MKNIIYSLHLIIQQKKFNPINENKISIEPNKKWGSYTDYVNDA